MIAKHLNLTLVLNNGHDAEKDGVYYEIKSCQKYISASDFTTKRRKGRFILEKKDFEGDKVFIFIVFDDKKLEWWGEIHSDYIKRLEGVRKVSQILALNYIITYGKLNEKFEIVEI